MGSRGPAPKPTALEALQGRPGRRPLNDREPEPGNRMPSAPRWMSVEAKRQWRRIAGKLHQAGLLTEVDGLALAMLCEAYSQYIEAKRIVGEEGMMAVSDKGNAYQHPAVSLMNSARGELLRWLREFGMTPSARSRIRLDAPNEKERTLADELAELVGWGK